MLSLAGNLGFLRVAQVVLPLSNRCVVMVVDSDGRPRRNKQNSPPIVLDAAEKLIVEGKACGLNPWSGEAVTNGGSLGRSLLCRV